MMAMIVRMPEISAGSDGAAIASWLVVVGDKVLTGQPIVEIETEKAIVEYAAEAEGVLAAILLAPGSVAEVSTPIAVLAAHGQTIDEALLEVRAVGGSELGSLAKSLAAEAAESPHTGQTTKQELQPDSVCRLFASPLVRKIARERGLDLNQVAGSGPNGRIARRDLEGVVAGTMEPGPSDSSSELRPPQPLETGPTTGGSVATNYVDSPHSGMRRAIARRLTESKTTVPHFYMVADCRVDELLALRTKVNAVEGVRVSVNDLVVKAVAGAMLDVPAANAIWTEHATRTFSGVDIAIAVSTPGGLLTPVVRGVEELSLGQLGSTTRELVERARAGKLKQYELEGGVFSVSNLGMYGTQSFAAIINPPHSGILAVGASAQRPVVSSEGAVEVATIMTVTLSADHRVVDGAVAAEWLASFQRRIEDPLRILV